MIQLEEAWIRGWEYGVLSNITNDRKFLKSYKLENSQKHNIKIWESGKEIGSQIENNFELLFLIQDVGFEKFKKMIRNHSFDNKVKIDTIINAIDIINWIDENTIDLWSIEIENFFYDDDDIVLGTFTFESEIDAAHFALRWK